jgi:hypothetical protein
MLFFVPMILRVQMVSGFVTKVYNFYLALRDRDIAEAISGRFPTTAARVRSYGICGRQSGTRASFLPVIRTPLTNIPPSTMTHLFRDVQ